MMTPQEIREKTFEKAVFGGYDMAAVDKFLEEMSADFTALQKETGVLKNKMKILVDKIEEYRTTEDVMNKALLSAQKMGSEIEREAQEKSEVLLREARETSESLINNARNEVVAEEARLVEAKRRSVEFIDKMRMLCNTQLDFFDSLAELKLGEDLQPPSYVQQVPQAVQQPVTQPVAPQPIPQPVPPQPVPQTTPQPVPQQPVPQPVQQPAEVPVTEPMPEQVPASESSAESQSISFSENATSSDIFALLEQSEKADGGQINGTVGGNNDSAGNNEHTKLFNLPRDAQMQRPKSKFQDLRFGENYDPDE